MLSASSFSMPGRVSPWWPWPAASTSWRASPRGVGYWVQELTVVDGQAGSPEATAVAYFGLKTPAHLGWLRLASPAARPRRRPAASRPAAVADAWTSLPRAVSVPEAGSALRRWRPWASCGRCLYGRRSSSWKASGGGRWAAGCGPCCIAGSRLRADSYILNDLRTNLTNATFWCRLRIPAGRTAEASMAFAAIIWATWRTARGSRSRR